MSRPKLTDRQRRELALRALAGESGTALANEYGVARQYPYKLADKVREDAQAKLEEAREELAFRERVAEIAAE